MASFDDAKPFNILNTDGSAYSWKQPSVIVADKQVPGGFLMADTNVVGIVSPNQTTVIIAGALFGHTGVSSVRHILWKPIVVEMHALLTLLFKTLIICKRGTAAIDKVCSAILANG